MAIEFDCPYCTSTIRVPDDASGMKGTCPRCETPILVPVVELPPQPASAAPGAPPPPPPSTATSPATSTAAEPVAAESPPEFAGFEPADNEPVFPGPPPSDSGEVPLVAPSPADTAGAPSYARALKRRRRRKTGMLFPLLFVAGVIAVALFLYWQSLPTLEGQLTAEALPDYDKAAGGIGRDAVEDLPEETVKYVLGALREDPVRLTSGLMETELRGVPGGVEARVFEGEKTTFFRVDPRRLKDFNDWARLHSKQLDRPRTKELSASVKRFFRDYKETEGTMTNLPEYRDPLFLGALVEGVGYHMIAVVDGQAFRCVYEDDERRLYFLLPQGTRAFDLEGRKLPDGAKLFPGHYDVTVE